MFYYISFLRPPPSVAPSSSRNISLTPQVANDLRTELFPGEIDLYYAWAKAKLPPDGFDPPSKAIKLTTWRTANAYKELSVPLPSGLRDGQSWRLLLTASDGLLGIEADRMYLADSSFGSKPFPVFSLPILFSNQTSVSASVSKQDSIRRIMVLNPTAETPNEPSVVIAEQTSYDLDKKLWDSGVGLSAWLVQLLRSDAPTPDESTRELRNVLLSKRPISAVELGAGTGIVSLILGALRTLNHLPPQNMGSDSADEPFCDTLITTDLETAMPILRHNVASNSHVLRRGTPEPGILDWDAEHLPQNVLTAQRKGLDLVILADVTYNTAAFPSLVRTIGSILRGSTPPPLVLLGYKERDPDERKLWDLASAIGVRLVKKAESTGAGGDPVEIWIGKFAPP